MGTQENQAAKRRADAAYQRALEGHNGWSNYETWLVNLWLDNDEGTQRHVAALAVAGEDYEAADQLKGYVEETLPELEGFAADLLGAALGEVNWVEIVRSIRSAQ